jgi:hypothetical protein
VERILSFSCQKGLYPYQLPSYLSQLIFYDAPDSTSGNFLWNFGDRWIYEVSVTKRNHTILIFFCWWHPCIYCHISYQLKFSNCPFTQVNQVLDPKYSIWGQSDTAAVPACGSWVLSFWFISGLLNCQHVASSRKKDPKTVCPELYKREVLVQ